MKRKFFEIKSGVTRLVFLIGNYAFKVPNFENGWSLFLRGLLCNIHENEWHRYTDLFCPVVFSIWGGWLTVMKRCESFLEDPVVMGEFFKKLSLKHIHMVERKPCSLGWLDGRLVAVDYGS